VLLKMAYLHLKLRARSELISQFLQGIVLAQM